MLFDQAASRRSQVRIGTQTTRSIEDDDEDEDDYQALLAPPNQPPEFLFIHNSNIQRTRFLQFAAGVITR